MWKRVYIHLPRQEEAVVRAVATPTRANASAPETPASQHASSDSSPKKTRQEPPS